MPGGIRRGLDGLQKGGGMYAGFLQEVRVAGGLGRGKPGSAWLRLLLYPARWVAEGLGAGLAGCKPARSAAWRHRSPTAACT